MKKIKLIIALLAGIAVAGSTMTLLAADETTITGNMVCGKCTLHETASCQNVVQVMDGTNTVNYYLEKNAVSTAAHDPVCHGDTEKVTVTGTVSETDGKKMLTPTKIDAAK